MVNEVTEATFPYLRAQGTPPAVGTIVTLPEPQLVEIAALAGCDWVFVDCEHGAISTAELSGLLIGAPRGTPTLVRIPCDDEVRVKQALDAGAGGIMCPMVEEAATVQWLVRWAKYPPQGARSVGVGRAHGYGLGFGSYLAQANDRTAVVVQIESLAGVQAIDEIAAVAGLGGVFIGPFDLSASMGFMGQPSAPPVQQAIATVIDRCHARDVPVGQFFGDSEAFRASPVADRLDFVALGIDLSLLAQSLRQQVQSTLAGA